MPFPSLPDMLEYHARRRPDAPAILAPGRAALTYGALQARIDTVGHALRAAGIGPGERVAVVMPNGAEMAVAVLGVAAHAVCAPINPAYGAEELGRCLGALQARAVITQAGFDPRVHEMALARGLTVIELSPVPEAPAGVFALPGEHGAAPPSTPVGPGDLALLFLTSGTTSRPKIVRLTHANICTAAASAGAALALSQADRCINVMPLFHGHGLICVVLSALAAGGSVVCTSGFQVDDFFDWLAAFRPIWYSAVPTIHQAIIAAARQRGAGAVPCRLRFIRSASAPMPPRIVRELEAAFGTCVIDTYAMTETAGAPVACQPLPPGERRTGSVGLPVGLDVAILGEGGDFLPAGRAGEIVVRGATVMDGYDGDPAANSNAFVGGWFRTGDLGFLDADGYLFLTGRAKEIINRGGEKIAPREVDEILLEHPAVAEAIAFPVPHPTLGEDVAAAIVLRPDATASAQDIRQFALGRLAGFKVPRQVLILGAIPKGPTGKVLRIGLAEKLGIAGRTEVRPGFVAPRTPLERSLAENWAEILQLETIGIHDSFFALGGNSLSAIRALIHISGTARCEFDMARFFEAPTIADIALRLEAMEATGQAAPVAAAIPRIPRDGPLPASIAQERLWRLQRALPGLPVSNVVHALRLTSAFDAAILERSLDEIVRRHEILRTSLALVDGQCRQVIAQQPGLDLRRDDLHGLPDAEKDAVGQRILRDELLHDFDLARRPLLRARLVRLDEREHLLLITAHHGIVDGWSFGVFVDELVALYAAFSAGAASPLAPPALQYADFAAWQRNWAAHPEMVAQLDYWRGQFRDPLPPMEFTVARPRRITDGLRTARRQLALPARLTEAVRRCSQAEGGTLFVGLVAGLNMLFHRHLGQEDLRLATLVANRNRAGTEGLIGPLANTVILRTNLGGNPTAREVVRRVRAMTLAAFAHQDLPFEVVMQALERERGIDAAALSQVMVILHNGSLRAKARDNPALPLEEALPDLVSPMMAATNFDFSFVFHEDAAGMAIACIYKAELFTAGTVDSLLSQYSAILQRMTEQPDQPVAAMNFLLDV